MVANGNSFISRPGFSCYAPPIPTINLSPPRIKQVSREWPKQLFLSFHFDSIFALIYDVWLCLHFTNQFQHEVKVVEAEMRLSVVSILESYKNKVKSQRKSRNKSWARLRAIIMKFLCETQSEVKINSSLNRKLMIFLSSYNDRLEKGFLLIWKRILERKKNH